MTIFALSSGAGRAGIAIVRVSGPAAATAVTALAGLTEPPPPRHAARVRLRDSAGKTIDEALCLWFPAPHSFTGEDVGEFHVHGSGAVVSRLLEELGSFSGLRLAEAGAFTRRAFENGKLDLTQVEGLADLIDAETEAQRRQAQRALDGEAGALYRGWTTRLTRALAHVETAIDFPDDVPPGEFDRAMATETMGLGEQIKRHLEGYRGAELVRDGVHVAIVGPPNVGKSSIINRLSGRDAAIVAPEAGTTRDVVEVAIDVAGVRVWLADTAGLREAAAPVEQEGVRRARAAAENADVQLVVFDAQDLEASEIEAKGLVGDRAILVANKLDLLERERGPVRYLGQPIQWVSAWTGEGFDGLAQTLEDTVRGAAGYAGVPIIRERHLLELAECLAALERSDRSREIDLRAEDLRLALRSLGRITGTVDVENLLDVIFRDFCIGK